MANKSNYFPRKKLPLQKLKALSGRGSPQESIHKFSIINESSLLNYCNTIFSTKPFSDEKYCETIEDYLTYTIYYLNKGHCFLDGNKRTTLLTTMFQIEDKQPLN